MSQFLSISNRGIICLLGLFCFTIIVSCNKLEKTGIGSELIPGTDKLITDTLYLNVETELRTLDSINLDSTSIQKNEVHCIGYINDPVFGQTSAAAYFQTLPFGYPIRFPATKDSLFLDSLVLSLAYAGTHGDTNAISRFEVYKVADPDFIYSKNYKLFESPQISLSEKLGTSQSFSRKDLSAGYKLIYKNDSVSNQLRIRLDDPAGLALGRNLLDQNDTTGAFKNDSTFKSFLNGFAIIPDSNSAGSGALHYFSLIAPATRLQLYYRVQKPDGKFDTTIAIFPFSADFNRSANANKIHRTPSAGITNDPQYAYVMTAPGISTNITIKGLDTLAGKPYIIHRAELIATQAEDNTASSIFTQPVTHLYCLNEAGQQTAIPYDSVFYLNRVNFDFRRNVFLNSISQEYCGGIPVYKTINNKQYAEYRYNLTRYIQNVMNKNIIPKKFRISAPYNAEFTGGSISIFPLNALAAGRVKLHGGAHPDKPMRLIIYYSKP